MTYLALIFIPPAYFLSRKKWGAFCLNSVLYRLACLCILSLVGIVVAPFFWALAVGHASFAYRKEQVTRHAELIASRMAEKMGRNK